MKRNNVKVKAKYVCYAAVDAENDDDVLAWSEDYRIVKPRAETTASIFFGEDDEDDLRTAVTFSAAMSKDEALETLRVIASAIEKRGLPAVIREMPRKAAKEFIEMSREFSDRRKKGWSD